MLENNIIGNYPIKSLFAELAQLDAALRALPVHDSDAELEDIMERHWAIREQIDAAPANSPDDMLWKGFTLQLEMARDRELECDGPGSARSLALALAIASFQFAGAAQ